MQLSWRLWLTSTQNGNQVNIKISQCLLLMPALLLIALAPDYAKERRNSHRLVAEVTYLQDVIVQANQQWRKDRLSLQEKESAEELMVDEVAYLQQKLERISCAYDEELVEAVKRGRRSHEYYLTHPDPYFLYYPSLALEKSPEQFHREWVEIYDRMLAVLLDCQGSPETAR